MDDTTPAGSGVARKGGIGKLVRGALYVHRDAIDLLPPEDQARIAQAIDSAATVRWNVARIETTEVVLLEYDDFETRAFPRLLSSTKIDATRGQSTTRDYRKSSNPLILHRKERMVRPDHPQRAAWASLTQRLEALGLFSDLTRIGRQDYWNSVLATAGLDPEGRPK